VLTRIGGFASAFLARGAGILVAALWSVGDDAASSFVRELYDRLRAGDELAKAVVDARQAAKDAGDATWLAYTVYGNPEAKLRLS
jgi:CHAT domain-containing protein